MRHTSKLSKLTHKKNSIDSFTSESRWKCIIKDDSRVGVGRSDLEQKVRDSFDDWEWVGVGGSRWEHEMVKPKYSTISELENIDLTNKGNFLKAKDINLGFGAGEYIANFKKSDLISKKSLVSCMNICITFITTIASNFFDRSPLTFVIVRNGNALNLNEIRSLEVKLLEKKKELILTHLIKVNILSTNDSYKALEQCSLFLEEIRWLHLDDLKMLTHRKSI